MIECKVKSARPMENFLQAPMSLLYLAVASVVLGYLIEMCCILITYSILS